MAIPQDFQLIMLPLLEIVSDEKEHNMNDVIDSLAKHFKLNDEEKSLRYPSGSDHIFKNKVRFARLYLLKAGLLEYPQRGFIKISKAGVILLEKKPNRIDVQLLEQFQKFVDFKQSIKESNSGKKEDNSKNEAVESKTPQELMEYGYQKIKAELTQEILSLTKQVSPRFFETLVIKLLLKMGYGGSIKDAGETTKLTGDGGIDGIIKEDKLGLDIIYIQAKRWENTVGEPIIRDFVGSLVKNHANKGVFITTSSFTSGAIEYVRHLPHKVILIDGDKLADLMIENDLGVSSIISYEIKKIDSDYFIEE